MKVGVNVSMSMGPSDVSAHLDISLTPPVTNALVGQQQDKCLASNIFLFHLYFFCNAFILKMKTNACLEMRAEMERALIWKEDSSVFAQMALLQGQVILLIVLV